MEDPIFDEILSVAFDEAKPAPIVVHRDPQGVIFAFHSPLNDGSVKCSICEGGARVYMKVEE